VRSRHFHIYVDCARAARNEVCNNSVLLLVHTPVPLRRSGINKEFQEELLAGQKFLPPDTNLIHESN